MKKFLLLATLLIGILVNAQENSPTDFIIFNPGLFDSSDKILETLKNENDVFYQYIQKTDSNNISILTWDKEKTTIRIYYFDNNSKCFSSLLFLNNNKDYNTLTHNISEFYTEKRKNHWKLKYSKNTFVNIKSKYNNLYETHQLLYIITNN